MKGQRFLVFVNGTLPAMCCGRVAQFQSRILMVNGLMYLPNSPALWVAGAPHPPKTWTSRRVVKFRCRTAWVRTDPASRFVAMDLASNQSPAKRMREYSSSADEFEKLGMAMMQRSSSGSLETRDW